MAKHAEQGNRIRLAIQRSGLSQTELAQKVGITQGYIAQMLSGERSGDKHIPVISAILNVDERWLRFGDDDVKPPWALSKVIGDPLHALSAGLKDQRKKHKFAENPVTYDDQRQLIDLLAESVEEQRRIRVLLESLVASRSDLDPPPVRRATIPRASASTPPPMPAGQPGQDP